MSLDWVRGVFLHVQLAAVGTGGGDCSCRHAGDPAICLAAAGATHRLRGLGQAREPHADRRLQDARRARLSRRLSSPRSPAARGLISATRGNHGQSLAFARSGSACLSPSSFPRATAARRTPPCARSAPSWWSSAAISTRHAKRPAAWRASAGWNSRCRFIRCW